MAVVSNTSPLTARRKLGAELRLLRDREGLTTEDVGAHLNCHNSKVSRVERGQRGCTARDFTKLMELYGVEGEKRTELAELAKRARQRVPPWWHAYEDVISAHYAEFLAYEAEAVLCRESQALTIPAYLQTPDYARAVTGVGYVALGPDQVDSLVEVRMRRQQLLREGDLRRYECVLTEAALRFHVGGAQGMRAQLRHLREAATLPTVELRVLPFSAGGVGVASMATFCLFSAGDEDPDVAFMEGADGPGFRDEPLTLQRLNRLFRSLFNTALEEEASLELIERIEKELV